MFSRKDGKWKVGSQRKVKVSEVILYHETFIDHRMILGWQVLLDSGSVRLIDSDSEPEVFFKKSVLKNVINFTGKHLCLKASSFIKKRLQYRCFPMKFVTFLKNAYVQEHLWTTAFIDCSYCMSILLANQLYLKKILMNQLYFWHVIKDSKNIKDGLKIFAWWKCSWPIKL